MFPITEKFKERWAEVRSHGRLRFIVVRGILMYGVTTGVLFYIVFNTIVNMKSGRQAFDLHWLTEPNYITISILIPFVVVSNGAIWGAFMWRYFENRYKKGTGELSNGHAG